MRILMVNALYPPFQVGGAERSVALLAQALARDGVEVHVATLWRGENESAVVEQGVTVHRLPLDQPRWPWSGPERSLGHKLLWHMRDRDNRAAAARLDRLIERIRPDVVHGHVLTGLGRGLWQVAKAREVAVAQTLRDYALICARSALFRKGRGCARRCLDCRAITAPTRITSRLVDVVAGNSDYTLEAHRAAGRFEGVAGRRLFNIVPSGGAVPAGHSRSGEPLRFGFLGRVVTEKGIDLLLAALPLIGRDLWSLAIGGAGRAPPMASGRDPRVRWLGEVEASAFYESIDVLIVPSRWPEPLPRTLIEGAAHGCGVIALASGGIGEVVGVADCATLVRSDDPHSLAEAMRAAIDAPERWCERRVSAEALAPFGEAAVVAAHHDFYEAALQRARERR